MQEVFGSQVTCVVRCKMCLTARLPVWLDARCVWQPGYLCGKMQDVFGSQVTCVVRCRMCLAVAAGRLPVWLDAGSVWQ